MNKRKHPRIELTGMVADISDGKGFFRGKVHDISRFGLALEGIQAKISCCATPLTIIIEGRGAHFKFRISPKWEMMDGRYKTIGGRIEQCSLAWTNFVMNHEPEPDDVWGNS